MITLTPHTYKESSSGAVATPSTGFVTVFADTDKKLKQKDSTGTVTDLTATGGGGGGVIRSINNITTNTTAGSTASTDYVYIATNAITVTLPTCVSNTNRYDINNDNPINGNVAVTVNCTGAENIAGETSIILFPGDSLALLSDNSQWRII